MSIIDQRILENHIAFLERMTENSKRSHGWTFDEEIPALRRLLDANAHLITPRPDLLSALVAVCAAYKEYDIALSQWLSAQQDLGSKEQGYLDAKEHHDRCFHNRRNANEQARAAIAKAT